MKKTEYEIAKSAISHLQTVLQHYWGVPDENGKLEMLKCENKAIRDLFYLSNSTWLEIHAKMKEEAEDGSNA